MALSLIKIYKQFIPLKSRNAIRTLAIRIRGNIFLRGHTFGCNICEKNFRKMLPHGNIPRPNAKCPNCLSLERTRVLWFYIKNEVFNTNSNLKVLHFAPEYGLKKKFKEHKEIEYHNVDINSDLADEVEDITNLSYPNESFDLVLCSHVLGHVPDEFKAIYELHRVLKPTGQALVMTIIDKTIYKTFEDERITKEEDRLLYYSEPDLVRIHGNDFSERLARCGFKVTSIDYRKELGSQKELYYNLGDGTREIIFRCTK